ncbi:MAG: hypothetical protein CMQ05_10695, partial [Gammaproteobacteria bacterium]|nr:hypothetical protein [Gammaproteobacteria bacterium]
VLYPAELRAEAAKTTIVRATSPRRKDRFVNIALTAQPLVGPSIGKANQQSQNSFIARDFWC